MSFVAPISEPTPNAPDNQNLVQPATHWKRSLLLAALSGLLPGAGHVLSGRRIKGWSMIVAFGAILSCMWPLRLPRFVGVVNVIALAWLCLALYAGFSAFLGQRASSEPKLSKLWMFAIAVLVCIWIKLLFTPLLIASGFTLLKVNSSAMSSTLQEGDGVLSDDSYYRSQAACRNDLVVLRRQDFLTIKRVIGLPGDTIQGDNRKILLNGTPIDEPFIQHTLPIGNYPDLDTFGPIKIPAGKYFVMGDNREVSFDSRMKEFGLLDASNIVGRPLYIYASFRKGRSLRKLH
ncbi:MAG TPA: signal peptidase I [Terriglobales bacterium]|nr:signal peptidase I [Terriglobales bacterium]